MAPSFISRHVTARSDTESPAAAMADQHHFQAYYIIGILIAVLLVVGISVWLGVRHFKKKAAFRREREERIRALNVRGLVKEGDGQKSYAIVLKGDTADDQDLTESNVPSEKAVLSSDASSQSILEHYTSEGKLPRPFAPFMADSEKASLSLPEEPEKVKRSSVASWMSIPRHSFISSKRSSVSSIAESTASGVGKDKRVIRQIFTPVLPDELVVSLGERLTVVNSYDDGWCIVGRDSVFKPGEVELGAIPAWCFMKAVKGLRAERPMRTASLGVTIQLDEPQGFGARDNVLSWSNF